MKMVRVTTVSGSFYPADKNQLNNQLKSLFGNIKKSVKKSRIVVSPHAGYVFSGLLAAESISCLEKSDVFVVLGTNHVYSGSTEFLFSLEDFSTPLGVVENEKNLTEKILEEAKNKGLKVEINESAHGFEHSIEVQLPFLQYLFKKSKFSMIPIIINTRNIESLQKFAEIIYSLTKKSKIKFSVIASSDFTHYGYNYNFIPFSSGIKENLYKLDKSVISEILKLNTKEFLGKAGKTTICGSNSIALAIEIAKKLEMKKAELLDYKTSADISKDYSNVVGYASIIFI